MIDQESLWDHKTEGIAMDKNKNRTDMLAAGRKKVFHAFILHIDLIRVWLF